MTEPGEETPFRPYGTPQGRSPKPESSHYPEVDRAIEGILGDERLTSPQANLLRKSKTMFESKVWDFIGAVFAGIVILAVLFAVVSIAVGITVRMIRWGFGI